MRKAVLFDLGGTLVHYFTRPEGPVVLRQAIIEVQDLLLRKNLLKVSIDTMWQRFEQENCEAKDFQVRPLEGRLTRIFGLDEANMPAGLIEEMCKSFMKPIFSRARIFEDTLPTLKKIKARNLKTAIVSNTTWGSPSRLWRAEVERHGLDKYMDLIIFCRNIGWRKPARRIFEFVLDKLRIQPSESLFVGDNPVWDVEGSRKVGMDAILIDRYGSSQRTKENPIRNLNELLKRI